MNLIIAVNRLGRRYSTNALIIHTITDANRKHHVQNRKNTIPLLSINITRYEMENEIKSGLRRCVINLLARR